MNTLGGLPIIDRYNNLLKKGKEQNVWGIMHEFLISSLMKLQRTAMVHELIILNS